MKQIINSWFCPLICIVLLLAGACSEDNTENPPAEVVPPTLTTENIPDKGIHFLYSALTTKSFTLSVNAPWEITKTAGWFVVSPKSGKAGEKIEITITGDYNEGEARTGEFTIRANSGNSLKPCYTEKTVQLSQDAFLQAGITVDGVPEDGLAFMAEETQPVTIKVSASYDWTLELTDESWVSVTPKSGAAGVETSVTVTPTANSKFEKRTSQIKIITCDPLFPDNKIVEEISLIQFFPLDRHAVGYSFFSDDFNWITPNWIAPYSKYGWPSVSVDGTNGNEFAVSTVGMKDKIDDRGYTYSASVYARYEGWLKLGKTSLMGCITTPALSEIDANKGATLLVEFDAAAYSSAGGTVDSGDTKMYLSVEAPATIGNLSDSEIGIEIKNVWSWTRYAVLVYGATADTKITIGSTKTATCRLYLDNISITRTKDLNPEAPDPQAVNTPLDKEILNTTAPEMFNEDHQVIQDGGTLSYSIRVNNAWTAEVDCPWLTITTVKCGATGTGVNNGAALADGKATVKATGLPYNNVQVDVAAQDTNEPRTGNILIKVDGNVIETIPVVQEVGAAVQLKITGLTDDAIEVPYMQNGEMKLTIRATHPWKITIPNTESWYTVSPSSGAAKTDVVVTVKSTQTNVAIRRFGSFLVTVIPTDGNPTLEQVVTVSQQTAAIGSVKWDLTAPVKWVLSAADMKKYIPDFAGLASDATKGNALPAEQGPGYISYTHTFAALPAECNRIVGGTGEPYVTGAWPGDSWRFLVPVSNLAVGTKVHFLGTSKTSGTGQLYWTMEYNDGGTWTPVSELKTETARTADGKTEQVVSYTHKVTTANTPINFTVTYANAISDGNIEFRMSCAANWQANNAGPLAKPNTGTMRWVGAANSPTIEIVQ